MDKQAVDVAAMRLRGIEQLLLHLSVSEYVIKAGDAEMFIVLMEDIRQIRELLEKMLSR